MKDFINPLLCNTKKLYHFTNFESACKILTSGKLLFSKIHDANDIDEFYNPLFFSKGVDPKEFNEEWYKYRQISFSIDQRPNKLGFLNSPMWAHYANKGTGVCLVFDKKKIEGTVKDKPFLKGEIFYDKYFVRTIIVEDGEKAASFFKKNYKELFFKKTSYWEYEQEYRILTKTENKERPSIPIKDALMAVIMSFVQSNNRNENESIQGSPEYSAIKELVNDSSIPILELGSLLSEKSLSKDGDTYCSIKTDNNVISCDHNFRCIKNK